jgi:hypothetical protein
LLSAVFTFDARPGGTRSWVNRTLPRESDLGLSVHIFIVTDLSSKWIKSSPTNWLDIIGLADRGHYNAIKPFDEPLSNQASDDLFEQAHMDV